MREAQHLVLTALVANRQIEFVTTKGDRINRRSLDLKIIWDDIEGIAEDLVPGKRMNVTATSADGTVKRFTVRNRIDTPIEVDYYKHDGILPYVLRNLAKS